MANELSSTDPHGMAVCHQPLGFCKNFHGIGEPEKTFTRDSLNADALHKVRGRKPAAHARPASRWENVITAGRIVAQRLRSPRSDKHSPDRIDFQKQFVCVFRQAEMLGSKAINEFASMVEGICNENGDGKFGGDTRHAKS